MSLVATRPPRASLVNLATNEELQFLFNPQTFEERFEAKYDRSQPAGLSHERMAFKNTSNDVIPIELYLDQGAQDRLAGTADSAPTLRQQKAWLQSLVYPASSQDYGYAGPPDVLFIWPRMVRLVGRITAFTFVHREFSNVSLATIRGVARLTFEERVSVRRLMEDVQIQGSLVVEEGI